jgi:hypothetical protein
MGAGAGRMARQLARRQREDKPPAAGVDGLEPEHVAEERARRLGVLSVEDRVGAGDHGGASLSRLRRRRLPRRAVRRGAVRPGIARCGAPSAAAPSDAGSPAAPDRPCALGICPSRGNESLHVRVYTRCSPS